MVLTTVLVIIRLPDYLKHSKDSYFDPFGHLSLSPNDAKGEDLIVFHLFLCYYFFFLVLTPPKTSF